jgi:hypothetical protein
VWKKNTSESSFLSLWLEKELRKGGVIMVSFGILCRFVDKHLQKWLCQPSENRKIHCSFGWPFI